MAVVVDGKRVEMEAYEDGIRELDSLKRWLPSLALRDAALLVLEVAGYTYQVC